MLFWIVLLSVLILPPIIVKLGTSRSGWKRSYSERFSKNLADGYKVAIFLGVLVMVFAATGLSPMLRGLPTKTVERYGLAALDDQEDLNRTWFITRTDSVIKFVQIEEDGGMTIQTMQIGDHIRIYEDVESPEEAFTTREVGVFDGSWYAPWVGETETVESRWGFHVPKGTVVRQLEVDISNEGD